MTVADQSHASSTKNYFIVKAPDGVDIAVQEAGNPAGSPIIFVHGMLGGHACWEKQVYSVDLSRHRLITFDLRGHGLSGKPQEGSFYSDCRRWADDLRTVIETT